MSELVTIHRPGEPTGAEDAQGNPIMGTPTEIVVAAIAVAPIAGTEVATQSGDLSTNGYTLYLPYGTDIRSTDMVTVRGIAGWHVEADAGQVDWASAFSSWTPGTVAVVRRSS